MRKFSILLLLCTLVLCLAACGNQGTTDDDIVGDDWRTWGTIQDTGTSRRSDDRRVHLHHRHRRRPLL